MKKEIPDDLIIKNLTGESTPDEDRTLWEWIDKNEANQKIFSDAIKIYSGKVELISMAEIEGRIRKIDIHKWQSSLIVWKIAASLCLMCVFAAAIIILLDKNIVVQETSFGVTKRITLPDGSRVWLNGGTTINYCRNSFQKRRNVSVEGEAYFEILPGMSPFVILYDSIEVSLDSGEVNIQSYSHELEKIAVVEQGMVTFRDLRNVLRQITASADHEIISRSDYGLLSRSINTNINFKAWVTGIYVFHDEPIERVISVMVNNNSKFNTKIDDIYRGRLISGVFQLDSLTNSQEDILHHIDTQGILWK
jgi:transmembrane sensor